MAEATTNTDLAISDSGMTDDSDIQEEQKSGFMAQLGNVDILRQVTLIAALAICLGIAVLIVFWAQEPDYRPLSKLPTDELIKTLDFLDSNKVEYKLDGDIVNVPESRYREIKLMLAREGLERDPTTGEDILMQDMGFGVSQRLERERLNHSREQQLATTIQELSDVARAKVLLAIPKENIFARRTKTPSATVVVTLKRGRILNSEEVDSIVDMVSSAVQGMDPGRVTVTDSNGRLLSSGSQNSISARSRKEYEIEKQREQEYLEKIQSILIPVLGIENFTAQVDVTMDFSATEETHRRFNPDLPAVRSEMILEQRNVGGIAGGIPGALSNQPPLDSAIPEDATDAERAENAVPTNHRRESTKNYELDQTISHTRQQTGVVRRLSVSVAVDYINSVNAENEPVKSPRTQEALSSLRRLLQGSIGFDVQRGDALEVVTIPFRVQPSIMEETIPFMEQPWFLSSVRIGASALVIIVLILAIVKPMLRRLMYPEQETYEEESLDSGLDLGDHLLDIDTSFDESEVGIQADGTLNLPDLHGDKEVLKAVRALVANEPELSAQVVKSWLNEDE